MLTFQSIQTPNVTILICKRSKKWIPLILSLEPAPRTYPAASVYGSSISGSSEWAKILD